MGMFGSEMVDVASLKTHALAKNNANKSLLAHSILIFSRANSANLFNLTCATVRYRVSVK